MWLKIEEFTEDVLLPLCTKDIRMLKRIGRGLELLEDPFVLVKYVFLYKTCGRQWRYSLLETLFFKLCKSDNSCNEFYSKVHTGVKQAPDQIRKAGLIESLKELGKYSTYFESKRAVTIKLLKSMKFIVMWIYFN